jgi:hypothetical protein
VCSLWGEGKCEGGGEWAFVGSLSSSGGTKASIRAGMEGARGKAVFSEAGVGCVELDACDLS